MADPDGGAAFEVCPTDGACRTGDLGGGAGQLSSPGGLTLDGAGNLYIPEAVGRRISVFGTAAPSFTRAFGFGVHTCASAFEVCTTASTCQVGLAGSAAGQLDSPFGAVTDPG